MQDRDDARDYEQRLEKKIQRLEAAMSFVARKAGAGCGQMTAAGKHEFLKDIQKRCAVEGWDVLGRKRNL